MGKLDKDNLAYFGFAREQEDIKLLHKMLKFAYSNEALHEQAHFSFKNWALELHMLLEKAESSLKLAYW